jgi:hypothetical protein
MTTGSAHHLHWTLVASIPSAASDGFSRSRRILYRALAVVVALAAISPLLLEAGPTGGIQQLIAARAAGSQAQQGVRTSTGPETRPLASVFPLHH